MTCFAIAVKTCKTDSQEDTNMCAGMRTTAPCMHVHTMGRTQTCASDSQEDTSMCACRWPSLFLAYTSTVEEMMACAALERHSKGQSMAGSVCVCVCHALLPRLHSYSPWRLSQRIVICTHLLAPSPLRMVQPFDLTCRTCYPLESAHTHTHTHALRHRMTVIPSPGRQQAKCSPLLTHDAGWAAYDLHGPALRPVRARC